MHINLVHYLSLFTIREQAEKVNRLAVGVGFEPTGLLHHSSFQD